MTVHPPFQEGRDATTVLSVCSVLANDDNQNCLCKQGASQRGDGMRRKLGSEWSQQQGPPGAQMGRLRARTGSGEGARAGFLGKELGFTGWRRVQESFEESRPSHEAQVQLLAVGKVRMEESSWVETRRGHSWLARPCWSWSQRSLPFHGQR